ncbi:catalase [Actinocorallia sp. B10E7]|uniref:catalase n=1 Tax=Actinocorallia sp. B10E7 TaxID=3153558 RepID=UPI00325C9ACC
MTHDGTSKDRQLAGFRVNAAEGTLTTDQGIRVDDTDNTLRPGERGPSLLQDFHFREKLTHFDHERIPERVVHARGAGAYGYFEPYDGSLSEYTKARFLTIPGQRTPVFVRFSTVAGSRGSADTVRDVRGFATKFYTDQGNFDLVGNNMPVFFIQDGIKFPDFVHAVKPEPHNEIPQASSAHDTLWDFVQLQPETTHMMMWLMSDRALPRSYRMMQGFGVHTFRFVDSAGRSTFVKFHWKPRLGVHSLVWDETKKIAGQDPDFNRRDLWEAIENGDFPEWELGVQLVPEEDEHRFDFDLLDATKIIPEEEVPVRPVGRLVLDRNPDNVFAETEQVAFHLGNVVPGIDVTNDPLLQARLFSYLDTQLIRLGGPNFTQIPVNRPVAEVATHHRDGYHQTTIHKGQASYHPNSVGGGCPALAGDASAYTFYTQQVDGPMIRKRAESFNDHYSQATLFWNSMSVWEKKHIIAAFRFELGKVGRKHIREGVVRNLAHVDHHLAVAVAEGVGVTPPERAGETHKRSSPALSQAVDPVRDVATRKIAVLVADGVDASDVTAVAEALTGRGAVCEVLASRDGSVRGANGDRVEVDRSIKTVGSVLYDAVYVPGGDESVEELGKDGDALHFVTEAYKHGKAVAGSGEAARSLLERAGVPASAEGVVTGNASAAEFTNAFTEAVAAHRHFGRDSEHVPA